jgi:hypothetical protein
MAAITVAHPWAEKKCPAQGFIADAEPIASKYFIPVLMAWVNGTGSFR